MTSMSTWGTLSAHFESDAPEHLIREAPTGSEGGPNVHRSDTGEWWVEGRLRDVSDWTSPRVLAWFCEVCEWVKQADLLWEIDGGPRYRYEARAGEIVKLRGILDA